MSPSQPPKRRSCAQMVVHELLAETQPDYRDNRLRAEEQTRDSIESGEALRVTARLVRIPVVVHVVHQAAEEDITVAQVKSQIDLLNRDFAARNSDKSKVPPVWKSLVTDAKIQFDLATKDPSGKTTDGITRTATTSEGFGPDNKVKSGKTGGHDAWPR